MKYIILALLISTTSYAKVFKSTDVLTKKSKVFDTKNSEYTVVYFLNAQCPCVQAHFDHLNELAIKHKDFQFFGLHVNNDISDSEIKEHFAEYDIKFPILHDRKLKYADDLNALKTPHVFILDKEGEIVFQGGATNSRNPIRAKKFYLRDTLKELAAGKTPTVKYAKALGCYINRG